MGWIIGNRNKNSDQIEALVHGIPDPVLRDVMRRSLYRLDALEIKARFQASKLSELGEWHEGEKKRWLARNAKGKIRMFGRTYSWDLGVSDASEE